MDSIDISELTKNVEKGDICSAHRFQFDDAISVFDAIAQQNEKNRSTEPGLPKVTVTHGGDSNSNQTLGLSVDKVQNLGYFKSTYDRESRTTVTQMSKPCAFSADSSKLDISQITKAVEQGDICAAKRSTFRDTKTTIDAIAQQNEKNRHEDASLPKITVTHKIDDQSNETLGLSVDKVENLGYLRSTRNSKDGIVVTQMSKPCGSREDRGDFRKDGDSSMITLPDSEDRGNFRKDGDSSTIPLPDSEDRGNFRKNGDSSIAPLPN